MPARLTLRFKVIIASALKLLCVKAAWDMERHTWAVYIHITKSEICEANYKLIFEKKSSSTGFFDNSIVNSPSILKLKTDFLIDEN